MILDRVGEWLRLGANIIGGCCRVTPSAVSALAARAAEELPAAMQHRADTEERDPRTGFDHVKRMWLEDAALRDRKKRVDDEVLVPSDLLEDYRVTPGLLTKGQAEKNLRAIFKHFGEKYPEVEGEEEGGEENAVEGVAKTKKLNATDI